MIGEKSVIKRLAMIILITGLIFTGCGQAAPKDADVSTEESNVSTGEADANIGELDANVEKTAANIEETSEQSASVEKTEEEDMVV